MALMIGPACVSLETSSRPLSVSQAGVQPLSATMKARVKALAPLADMTLVRSGGLLASGITYGAALYQFVPGALAAFAVESLGKVMAKSERNSRQNAAPSCNSFVLDMCDSLRYSLLTVLASDPVAASYSRSQAGTRSAEFKLASSTQNIRHSGSYVKMSRPVIGEFPPWSALVRSEKRWSRFCPEKVFAFYASHPFSWSDLRAYAHVCIIEKAGPLGSQHELRNRSA